MEIEILGANKKIYEEKSRAITLPAKEGELQVLDDHAPLFTLLDKGEIILEKGKISISEGNKIPSETRVLIFSGVAEVLNNKVTVLIKEL